MKKVQLPLEVALRKVSPELEKSVKVALKRAWAFGLIIGALFGVIAAAGLIAWNVSPHLVKNAQPCDLFAFGPVRPDLPASAPQVCWQDVNVPDYNGQHVTVFVCPTRYNLRIQSVMGDVNAEIVKRLYDACVDARKVVGGMVVSPGSGSEVNG